MPESTYVSRYGLGEREAVWQELVSLGAKALAPPVFSDAQVVAGEIVSRAHHNLLLLRDRLAAAAYRFEFPDEVLVEATEADRAAVTDLEQSMGALPLVVRTWYQRIASVNFRQHPDQLRYREDVHTDSAELAVVGLGLHVPLVFLRIGRCLELRRKIMDDYTTSGEQPTGFDRFFTTGDVASNCEPKGLVLASQQVDGTLYNDGGGNVCFVDELRKAFALGGFPFWSRRVQYRYGAALIGRRPDFEKLLASLADGLLAL